jgi:hypothetical protein
MYPLSLLSPLSLSLSLSLSLKTSIPHDHSLYSIFFHISWLPVFLQSILFARHATFALMFHILAYRRYLRVDIRMWRKYVKCAISLLPCAVSIPWVKFILPLKACAFTLPPIGFANEKYANTYLNTNCFEICVCTLLKANAIDRRARTCALKDRKTASPFGKPPSLPPLPH